MTNEQDFQKRAHQHYLDTIDNLNIVASKLNGTYEPENEEEEDDRPIEDVEDIEEYREPLCISAYKMIEIEMSTGGPADGYELYYDNEGDLIRGCYWFQDWFQEKARFWLSNDELSTVTQIYSVESEFFPVK